MTPKDFELIHSIKSIEYNLLHQIAHELSMYSDGAISVPDETDVVLSLCVDPILNRMLMHEIVCSNPAWKTLCHTN